MACLLAAGTAGAQAAPGKASAALVANVDEGSVDWGAGVIRVQGSGRPRRISPHVDIVEGDLARAATEEVVAKLLSTVRALPADATRSVGQLVDADEAAAGRLAEAVRGYETARRATVSDNSVVVRATLSLDRVRVALDGEDGAGPAAGDERGVVVLDARGRRLVPVLRPVVRDESGGEVVRPREVRYATRPAKGGLRMAVVGKITSAPSTRPPRMPGSRRCVMMAESPEASE